MTGTLGSTPQGTGDSFTGEKNPKMQSSSQENAEESEPEAVFQPCDTDKPGDPSVDGTGNSNELLQEIPNDHILSELPTPDENLPISQQAQNSNHTEEANPSLSHDEQDPTMNNNSTMIDNIASQSGKVENAGQSQLTINQKNAQIWNELGYIYYNTGAFEEALHAFEMAVELDPSCGWSYNNLASIYFHQKHYADAIPLYQKGLQLLQDTKDKALLWNRLGDTYRRLDERDQAAAAYRKAIELDPDNVSLLARARFSLLANLRV